VVEWLTLLRRVWKVPGSNLGQKIYLSPEGWIAKLKILLEDGACMSDS
jgi:hypothetical protein